MKIHKSSFKDPNGSVIEFKGAIVRVIKNNYVKEYDHLMSSGLFHDLRSSNLIIDHQEIGEEIKSELKSDFYKAIKPSVVTISYPSEWTFSQLKDAAIATLKIQQIAIKYKMILKDCSAYNIQFYKGRAVLIDTLSFRFYIEGEPWMAYRQFCEHFFGPLLLISKVDAGLSALFNAFIDGIPLELVNKLLKRRNKVSLGVLLHIVLHTRSKIKYKSKGHHATYKSFNADYIKRLTEDLLSQVLKIEWNAVSNWSLYYKEDVSDAYLHFKIKTVSDLLLIHNAKKILDFGANDGTISRHLGGLGFEVIATDSDQVSVERNYLMCKREGLTSILPLVIDAINPTPSFGWANSERQSFFERIEVDTVLALALIHHLVIFYNIPFYKIAIHFASVTSNLIIEFVPKSDPMVQTLLQSKEDIYDDYTRDNFELEFSRHFKLIKKVEMTNSERLIYLFTK